MPANYATKTVIRTKQAQNNSLTLTADPADSGKRLDSFIHERLPEYSRSRLQSWIKQDRVQVNSAPARASHLLRAADTVSRLACRSCAAACASRKNCR